MSPRSLLFSSDQETTRLLSQALHELEIEVDHCPEIFAALKRLTTRIYDVIAVDWDEGLEAGFFLKTARELKSNQNAFAIIIAKPEARADVRQVSANVVLSKPVLPAHATYTLLTCDEFLSRMATWPPRSRAHPTAARAAKTRQSTSLSARAAAPAMPTPARAQVSALPRNIDHNRVPEPPAFGTLETGLLEKPPLRQLLRRGLLSPVVSRLSMAGRGSTLLRVASLGVAFFAVGYVFSQPLTRAAVSAVEISRDAWERTGGRPHQPQAGPQVEVELVQSALPDSPHTGRDSSARIRVLPVRDAETVRANPASQPQLDPTAVQPEPSRSFSPAQAAGSGIHIPQSLEAPFPGVTAVRNVAARMKPALLDALEPVNLPGYLSDTLLLDRVEPSYPEQALRAGLQGPVVLHAWIGRDGRIRDLKLIRGSLLLGAAACQAVKQWRYKPYLLNGEAVEAQTYVTVDFKLP